MTVWNEHTEERGRRGSVQKLDVDWRLWSSASVTETNELMSAQQHQPPGMVCRCWACSSELHTSTSELSIDVINVALNTVLGLFAARFGISFATCNSSRTIGHILNKFSYNPTTVLDTSRHPSA
jgi:hypothetical protein